MRKAFNFFKIDIQDVIEKNIMQENDKEPDFCYYHHRLYAKTPSDSCSVISSSYGAKNRISLVNNRIEYKPPSAIGGLSRNSSIRSKQSIIKIGTQNRFLGVPKQTSLQPAIANTSSTVRFFIDNNENNNSNDDKNMETPI
jgi:hypothetical protein